MSSTLQTIEQYGHNFQIKVISSLLGSKNFLTTVHDILSPDYFPNQSHKWIVSETLKYFRKYNTTPTLEVLKVEMKKLTNDVLKSSIKEQLKQVYLNENHDAEYIEGEFLNFCKNQTLKNALLNSVDLLNAGDYDSIRQLINNAVKAGQDRNIGHEYAKDVETRYRENSRNVIPFPWKAFNNITQGGYGNGDLVLLFGNPKGGKSWAAIAMAAEAVKLGFDIVFYALELDETYVGKRFDAYFTGIPVDELDNRREEVERIIQELPGQLIIKGYSPKRASLNTIETHISQLEFKPHAVFIDYLDLLKNPKSRAERKDDTDDIYTSAKGLAKELKIPIVSPSQANRTGAEKAILESSHIAGSFDKIMIGDIVVSLSRTRIDRINGTGRWHFMGNRYGPDGCTFNSPKIDTSIGYFEIDENEMDEDDLESFSKNSKNDLEKEEKKFLKKKFFELESL